MTFHNLLHTTRRGSSALGIFFIFILIFVLIFLLDMGYIFASSNCIDENVFSCAMDELFGDEEEEAAPEGSVTAVGSISGEFKGETHSITITATFPLEGGDMTGTFEGACDGNIKGSFTGGNGGTLSGKAKGSCAFVFPASGEFSGPVNTSTKTVPVNGKGSAMGVSKEGSLTLSY